MTIVEFLTARLDDDEAVALAACAHWEHPDSWECKRGKALEVYGDRVVREALASPDPLDVAHVGRGARHIALHDPVRVLAEVKAKRQIVERAQFVDDHGPAVDHVRALDMSTGAASALRDVLEFLALPYADHKDFQEAWYHRGRSHPDYRGELA